MEVEIKKRIEKIRESEVPEGYKEEVPYILPCDWSIKRLGKLTVRTSRRNKGIEDIPACSINNQKGFVPQDEQFDGGSYINLDKTAYKVVLKGEFAYNPARINVGSIGRLNRADKAIVSSLYVCFKLHEKNNGIYFQNWFDSYDFSKEVIRNLEGSVREYLFYENFSNIKMPLPPVPEQEKIAEILTQCDKVIELKKQLIEEKKRQKKWLMQNLLNPDSGVRLSNFKGNWTKCTLASLGTFLKGTGISNADCMIGDVPCIKYGDIYMSYDTWFKKSVSYTDRLSANSSPKVPFGTLLFTGSGEDRMEIGKCTAYLGTETLVVGGDIIIMKPDRKRVDPLFLAYQQSTEMLIRQKARIAQGYSIVHLYGEHIKGLQLCIPSTIEEQTAIANILVTADCELNLLEQELAQWQTKKKSLMQLLLTGIVRVNV